VGWRSTHVGINDPRNDIETKSLLKLLYFLCHNLRLIVNFKFSYLVPIIVWIDGYPTHHDRFSGVRVHQKHHRLVEDVLLWADKVAKCGHVVAVAAGTQPVVQNGDGVALETPGLRPVGVRRVNSTPQVHEMAMQTHFPLRWS